jgi:hypothetical protein
MRKPQKKKFTVQNERHNILDFFWVVTSFLLLHDFLHLQKQTPKSMHGKLKTSLPKDREYLAVPWTLQNIIGKN